MRISAISNVNSSYNRANFTSNKPSIFVKNPDNTKKEYTQQNVQDSYLKGLMTGVTACMLLLGGNAAAGRLVTQKQLSDGLDNLQDEFRYGDVDKYQYNIIDCNGDDVPDVLLYRPDDTYAYIDVKNRKVIGNTTDID